MARGAASHRALRAIRNLGAAIDLSSFNAVPVASMRALARSTAMPALAVAASARTGPLAAPLQARLYSSLPPHSELLMPALSPTMTHGNLVAWKVAEGQAIAPGDELAEVETDKATISWENQDEGYVAKLLVPQGAQGIAVGQPVAILVEEEEEVAAFKDYAADGVSAATEPPAAGEAAAAAPSGGSFPEHALMAMPALSPTMTQGNIIAWRKKAGDEVAPGDVLAEVETDKATIEWEAQEEGVIAKILQPDGAQGVVVGSPVLVMVDDVSAVPAFEGFSLADAGGAPAGGEAEAAPAAAPEAAPAVAAEVEDHEWFGRLGPAARILLEEAGLTKEDIPHPSGPHGMVTKADVLEAVAAGVKHSEPRGPITAKKSGSQPAAAAAKPAAAPAAAAAPTPAAPAAAKPGAGYTDIPNSQVRKIIAQRLSESKASIPHAYFSADVELDAVSAMREALKQQGSKVSVNDFVIKAVAMALAEVPAANVLWDSAASAAAPAPGVDVAVAVATEGGLLTPIVRAANTKSLLQIGAEVRELAARARDNKLKPEEFQGGSFTISNLGMFGVDKFFAIINPPQACIMAVGGARQVAVLGAGGTPLAKTQMTVTLSADGRVYDSEVASQFLASFERHMAAPFTLYQ